MIESAAAGRIAPRGTVVAMTPPSYRAVHVVIVRLATRGYDGIAATSASVSLRLGARACARLEPHGN
jgi:hypothetical protein